MITVNKLPSLIQCTTTSHWHAKQLSHATVKACLQKTDSDISSLISKKKAVLNLSRFRNTLKNFDKDHSLRTYYTVDEERDFMDCFTQFMLDLNMVISVNGLDDPFTTDMIVKYKSYFHESYSVYHSFNNPLGYHGDYLLISHIYGNRPCGNSILGLLIDKAILHYPEFQSVRKRYKILSDKILQIAEEHDDDIDVTCLASGPAEEIRHVLDTMDTAILSRLQINLIDDDEYALAYSKEKITNHPRFNDLRNINYIHANIVYILSGKQKLDLQQQDLIYSLGMTDYFKDATYIRLVRWVFAHLKLNGIVSFGNIKPDTIGQPFMQIFMDWKLIARSEPELQNIFKKTNFMMCFIDDEEIYGDAFHFATARKTNDIYFSTLP
jgi:hypothetical protein